MTNEWLLLTWGKNADMTRNVGNRQASVQNGLGIKPAQQPINNYLSTSYLNSTVKSELWFCILETRKVESDIFLSSAAQTFYVSKQKFNWEAISV